MNTAPGCRRGEQVVLPKSSELQVGRKVERDVGSQPASLGLRFRTEPVRSTKHFCDVDTKDSSRGAGCLLTSVCD